MVEKLKQESYNPVLLYKPQGRCTLYGPKGLDELPFAHESFALGLQTEEQKAMMIQGCNRILCIDSTHKTNQYDFFLINLIVPDEFGAGYPVAHFITNHLDYNTMYHLFLSIKCAVPELSVNCIMTDDDKTSFSAFNQVFGPDIKHLLCKWHVHHTWHRKLFSMVPDCDLRKELYLNLTTLMEENNSGEFAIMMDNFLQKFLTRAPSFIKYFEEQYYCRANLWAMSYRNFPHAFTDTNMYCESFHNKIKTMYFKRKFNRRLDNLINLLLKIEEDIFIAYNYKIKINCKPSVYPPLYHNRHESGMKIPDDSIIRCDTSSWVIKSQSNNSIQYSVKLIDEVCPLIDHCYLNCIKLPCLNLCSHMYFCDCGDVSRLCKHIHKIHSFACRQACNLSIKSQSPIRIENNYPEIKFNSKLVSTLSVPNCTENKIENCGALMSELLSMLPNPTVQKVLLSDITKNFKNMVSNCRGVLQLKHLQEFSDKLPCPPHRSQSKNNATTIVPNDKQERS
ncbi:uncharacterized protein LOC118189032 [Stegodyphus dumicola]|uniref:uncharacterized protein LOC118189032 n=1 Tax=Stegodyphus dumicola TaxID=202533 RepID=UPI0015AC3AEC|nr:uncharacterized protein LOC118189032 [Stegodyphus dumicola]